jgi:hypothetical protein
MGEEWGTYETDKKFVPNFVPKIWKGRHHLEELGVKKENIKVNFKELEWDASWMYVAQCRS